jgi:hypothetical protein
LPIVTRVRRFVRRRAHNCSPCKLVCKLPKPKVAALDRTETVMLGTGNERRGQGLVEFALVLPVLMLLLLITVDFGRLFFTYIAVTNSAREAAFAASQDLDSPNLLTVADQESNVQGQGGEGALSVGTPSCAAAYPLGSPATTCPPRADTPYVSGAGHQVAVSVGQDFTFWTPMITAFFGTLHLSSSATAPVISEVSAAGGGGPGATPDPCDVLADFTFDQTKWNGSVSFDASQSTPTACSDNIKNYKWNFDDTQGSPSGSYDETDTKTSTSNNYKGNGVTYYVTLTVTTYAGKSDTFQQAVITMQKP